MSASLGKCPCAYYRGSNFTNRSRLFQYRQPLVLKASVRKLSVVKSSASSQPSFDDFEHLPDSSSFNFDDSLSHLSNSDWEMDAAMMPWAAGLNLNSQGYGLDTPPQPLIFYPTSQRVDLSFDEERNMQHFSPRFDRPCYVIIFTMPGEQTEGIYTLRTTDDLDLPIETVVAFEEEVDAQRFATFLEASLYFVPSVMPISWGDMTDWCNENNARCRLEPRGSLLIPPDAHVGVTDWERSMALQRGQYSVLEEEPVLVDTTSDDEQQQQQQQYASSPYFESNPDWAHDVVVQEATDLSNIVDGKLADSTLAAIRADLERLLKKH